MGLALSVGLLHAALLVTDLALGEQDRSVFVTATSVAWWWGSAAYQLFRGTRITPLEKRCALGGHAVSLTALGLLSQAPGEAWACSMGLVALPLAAAVSQDRATVVWTLALSSLGASALVITVTRPVPLAVYCTASVLLTILLPTLLHIRLRGALRAARDEALRLAAEDPLTGLLNRRALAVRFGDMRAAAPLGHRAVVVALDLDRFKMINDEQGHDAGDRVLKTVAEVMRLNARAGDLLVRLGGEELAWVGCWAAPQQAREAAERLRAAVATAAPGGVHVTTSIGVAFSTDATQGAPDAEALSRLLVRADGALYEAKRTGRDRVVLAPDQLPDGTDPHHARTPAPRERNGGAPGVLVSASAAAGGAVQRA